MNKTKNDLPLDVRKKMIDLLNARLADSVDLQTQVKQAHWNVKGPSFIAIHELFDDVAEAVENSVDMIAERAVQLGGTALGTARIAAAKSTLTEYPHDITDGMAHVDALSSALAAVAKKVREAIDEADTAGDANTADLFTQVSRDLDKYLWFVEAHLGA